jgi:ATP-dependent HslUV protease ATP-binding subunit HslU
VDDFKRILREPHNALTKQYVALLNTEGVTLEFTESGIDRLAEVAFQVNERTENIGARRLHTVMERLLESVSFEASERGVSSLCVDARYVDEHLGNLAKDEDLSRYIL